MLLPGIKEKLAKGAKMCLRLQSAIKVARQKRPRERDALRDESHWILPSKLLFTSTFTSSPVAGLDYTSDCEEAQKVREAAS